MWFENDPGTFWNLISRHYCPWLSRSQYARHVKLIYLQSTGIKAVCICALLCAADGITMLTFSSWKLLFTWGAYLAAFQAIRPLRTSYVLMATHRGVCPATRNALDEQRGVSGAVQEQDGGWGILAQRLELLVLGMRVN